VTDGKSTPSPLLRAFPADGYEARWTTWDGEHGEALSLAWENEAWTAVGSVERHDIQYVIRLSPLWQVRQFILFRDMDEPDLWLGNDGRGRWGEMNGAHRTDLDGSHDVSMTCTPFVHTLPIRRLPLSVGDRARLSVLEVDVETLGVVPAARVYERVDLLRWRVTAGVTSFEFDVDEYGVAVDIAGRFRRIR
jgi:hypothetical protein